MKNNEETPAALIIHAENNLLSFTINQEVPGESGDVESTAGWGGNAQISRYHCFFTDWEQKQELSTLLLLDANLFPILSSPTGFETC